MNKLWYIILLSAMALGACAPIATLEVVHLKVGVLNFLSNSPLFIAQEEGYFAEQRLEVELVNFGTNDRDMIPAMLADDLDIASATVTTATLNAMAQGGNLKYVADKGFISPAASCAADGWVVRKALLDGGSLNSPADMAGLNMTFSQGNMFEYVADLLLADGGLTRSDVQILDIRDQPTRLEAMLAGTLDITPISEPWISRMRAAGAGEMWLPLAEVIPNYSVGTIIFGPSMFERDPDVGVRFMKAYLKAIEQFNEGKTDRNLEIIAGFTEQSPDELREICWTSFKPDGKIEPQGLIDFQQWAVDMDYLDAVMQVEDIWDPNFVDQARAELNP